MNIVNSNIFEKNTTNFSLKWTLDQSMKLFKNAVNRHSDDSVKISLYPVIF